MRNLSESEINIIKQTATIRRGKNGKKKLSSAQLRQQKGQEEFLIGLRRAAPDWGLDHPDDRPGVF